MIHNAVAEHNLIPHTADDRGVTPGYQRNWTRAPDLNTAALLRFSARERCRLREAERGKKLAEIRAASTARPVVYANEQTSSEELASFRKNNPGITFVP